MSENITATIDSESTLRFNQYKAPAPPVKGWKKNNLALICFCMVNFLVNASLSIITTFYPPMAKDAGLSVGMISIVFAIQPVGSFFFSFAIGQKMNRWGRKKCMNIGLLCQIITIIAFGWLELVSEDPALLMFLSLLLRFIQGVSGAAYSAVSFAYVPIMWPHTVQKKISIMESLTGLGLMSGPFLGAGLYYLVGYQGVFYIMGTLFSLSLIPSLFFLPEDDQRSMFRKKPTFSNKLVYENTNVILLALLVTMTGAGTTFINPMFSIHMQTYGVSEDDASLMLGSWTIMYVICINFIPTLCRKFDKKLILTVGILLSALGDIIIAPNNGLPNRWWIMLVGLPVIGVASAMCILPAIPQFIDYLTQMFPLPEQRRQVSDISSSIFVGSYSLGLLVGPLLGGLIYEGFQRDNDSDRSQQLAFKWTSLIMALLQIVLAILFFFLAGAYKSLMKDKVSEELLVGVQSESLDQDLSDDGFTEIAANDIPQKKSTSKDFTQQLFQGLV